MENEECKFEVHLICNEDGESIMFAGNRASLLTALSAFAHDLYNQADISEEEIIDVVEFGLRYDEEDEEDVEIENIDKSLNEIFNFYNED